MATNSTPSACVVVTALSMQTKTESAILKMTALAPLMSVAFATVLVRFTTAVATRFQQGIAIVMAISWMPWAFAVARACQTPMAMRYVMTLIPA